MSASLSSQLDKSVTAPMAEGYGTITIRVVVVQKASAQPAPAADAPADTEADEVLPEQDKRPTAIYLEEPKRGRHCCVFLINGQRQHVWDNTFIVRDLELKYLRNRTIVVVDVDGLKPEFIAELMQGSRHQFYEGKVYEAIAGRVIATLKGDPDLKRLEAAAEDEIASLEAGDEAVKAALDQLIQEHHDRALHVESGHNQPGDESRETIATGSLLQTENVVVTGDPADGDDATGPVLVVRPDVATVRLKPDEPRRVSFAAKPEAYWVGVTQFGVTFDPPVRELRAVTTMQINGADVELSFDEPEDFEDDEYPVETLMRATAKFAAHDELRLCERRIVINRLKPVAPPPKPSLRNDPTVLRITSRQPVKIVPGGPDVHVKLRWDGADHLVVGPVPIWTFRATCSEPAAVPGMSFTVPVDGRFELLIQSSAALDPGDQFTFTVEANGPAGKTLTTSFLLQVVSPPEPRKLQQKLPGGAQRRPPYELKYVHKDDWDKETCWGATAWTKDDPGSFQEPTTTQPLTLFVNQDMELLATYREKLLAKRLAESTIQERTARYTSHVAFHLYQIYLSRKTNNGVDGTQPHDGPTDGDEAMRAEIKRVAMTLVMLMDLSR